MDEARACTAKAAIAELITRYAVLTDAGDWDAVAALYTEDGRMNRPTAPEQFVTGRAAILAAFRARPRRASRHIVANVLITLEGETCARATSQILLFTGSAAADGGLPVLAGAAPLVGTYEDTLVKSADGWRFAVRRGSLDFRA
jgi:ketosteroid isomerase-like protein